MSKEIIDMATKQPYELSPLQVTATVRLRDAEIIALVNVIRAYETMLKE